MTGLGGLSVVALDLSLTATGIATTHASNGEPRLSCRTVAPPSYPKTTTIDHRRMHATFAAITQAVACKPDLVVIEFLPAVRGTGGVPLRLAELHGITKHWLWSRGLTYVDVEPQHAKTYATGKGNAKKDAVRAEVTARYGSLLHIGTSDEADAVALLGLALHGYGQPLANVPESHRVAVGKVRWPALGGARCAT